MAKVTKKSLAKSSASGMLAELWRIGSRLFLTPIIISKIGLAGYGIWTILFSITGQLGIVNVSIGVAYAKLTSEYDSRGDYRGLTSILSSGIILITSFALIVLPTIWFVRVPLLSLLNVPDDSIGQASQALAIVTTVVMIRFSFGCVIRVLEGLQRLDIVYLLKIMGSVIDFCITMTLLVMGYGLIGLAVGFAVGELLTLAIARYYCFKLEPRIRITPFRASRQGFSKILRLGGKFQFLSIMSALFKEGARMLVSIFFGVSMLGIYELARKLIMLGGTAGRSIVSPLLSAFSNLHTQKNAEHLVHSLYFQSSRVLAFVTALCFTFIATYAGDIVFLWTGESLPLTAWTIRALAFGAFLQTLTGVGTASLRARGKIRLELITALIVAVIIFGSAWPLSKLFNYKGLVLAFVAGGITSPIWFLMQFHKLEGVPSWVYVKTVVIRPLCALAPAILLYWALNDYGRLIGAHFQPRVQVLLQLASWGIVFSLVAAVTNWFIVLSPEEREALTQSVAKWLRRDKIKTQLRLQNGKVNHKEV